MSADLANWSPPPAPPADLALNGRHVRLERTDPARHAADLHAANLAEPSGRNWAYLPYGPFASLDDYISWMAQTCGGGDPHFFTLIDLATGRAAGLASLLRISPAAGSIEVGHIHFGPALQKSIAATEAMFLLMRWAFETGYRRYEWKCDAANLRSRRAAERLGFSYEGIFRQAAVVKGRNRDTAWFAAIDSEWPALKDAFETWLSKDNFTLDGRQRQRLWDLTAPIRVSDDPGRG